MTQNQLIDILTSRLMRDNSGTKHRWRKLIAPVQIHSTRTHAHCNWSVNPTASNAEIATIELLLDEVRLSHPILTPDR